jgi:formyl-CoA transferase
MGNQHPSIAPYETLRCADGLLAVACGNDGQFRRMAAALGRPALADDARFATNPDRVVNRPALVTLLEQALAGDTAAGWEQRLGAAGVPAALVGDIGSAFAHAADYGLDPTVAVGTGRQVRHPVRYAANNVAAPSAPPGLGEHTALVREWLDGPDDGALPGH